jgi:hypothetical protein
MNDKLWYQLAGGRKFVMCVGFGAAFCLMYVFGPLSESGFITLMGGTVLGFIAGNVGQKALTKDSA